MADETLLMLIRDVRGKTLKLLDGLTDEQARFTAPGLANSILWHAGHSWVVNEYLGIGSITGKPPVYPDGWFETFSWQSKPALVENWPRLSEVVEHLREQQQRLASGVEQLSPSQLAQVIGDPSKGRTVRYGILHGLHDEAQHQGEIWLLKKMSNANKNT